MVNSDSDDEENDIPLKKSHNQAKPSLLSSSSPSSKDPQIGSFKQRYVGHCNVSTDIKEANFFGDRGQFVVTGSDDGRIFIWEKHTTKLVNLFHGDRDVVNCLQCHPVDPILATSGIEQVIRLWAPLSRSARNLDKVHDIMTKNQRRMEEGPGMISPALLQDIIQQAQSGDAVECRMS